MSPTNIGLGKVTGTISKWFTGMNNMHPGQKLYASLWGLTGILLIVEIVLQIMYSNETDQTIATSNAIAGILIVLIITMIAAIFTTVIVSIRLRKMKNLNKQGGKK